MSAFAFHVARGLLLTVWGIVLLVGLSMLALGALGIFLILAPDPSPPSHLGQAFGGFLLVLYVGTPGLVLTGLGAWMFDAARQARLED